MATNIELLLILQNTDRKLAHLEKQSMDVPARKEQIESRIQRERDAVTESEQDINHKKSDLKQIELEVDSIKERISRLRKNQMDVKSNDEYRIIDQEVRYAEQEISKLEEKELGIMEQIEALNKVCDTKKRDLENGQQAVQGDLDKLDKRLAIISEDIAKLKTEREGLLEGIDVDWLSRYERIFKSKGDYALVATNSGTCGGCHMKLPPQVAQDAKKGLTMVSCPYCSRLLYAGR